MDGDGGSAAKEEREHKLEMKNQIIRELEEELAVSKRLTANLILNMDSIRWLEGKKGKLAVLAEEYKWKTVLMNIKKSYEEENRALLRQISDMRDEIISVKECRPMIKLAPLAKEAPLAQEAPVEEAASLAQEVEAPMAQEAPVEEEAPLAQEASVEEEAPLAQEATVKEEATLAEEASLAQEPPMEAAASPAQEAPVEEAAPLAKEAPVEHDMEKEITSLKVSSWAESNPLSCHTQ